jgi:NAD-dependent oxidoreductase involved in siderophore biosynthesis
MGRFPVSGKGNYSWCASRHDKATTLPQRKKSHLPVSANVLPACSNVTWQLSPSGFENRDRALRRTHPSAAVRACLIACTSEREQRSLLIRARIWQSKQRRVGDPG